jgi:hypothetical protein
MGARRLWPLLIGAVVAIAAQSASSPSASAGEACQPWTVRTVVNGLGLPLENLAFDGRGALLVSKTLFAGEGSVERITPGGGVSTLMSVRGPGAISVRGSQVYFNTGHVSTDGTLGLKTGTIDIYDLDSGQRRTWARNLTMPDGGTILPNGDAVISTLIGPRRGLWLVRRDSPDSPQPYGPAMVGPNGMVVSNDHRSLYVVDTGGLAYQIVKIDLAHPSNPPGQIRIAAPAALNIADDITIDAAGMLYTVGEHGIAYRIDPESGATCVIAIGVHLGSSLRFGAGPGWDPHSLYTTGFDGAVRQLVPPQSDR